jgi:heme/copper-type cytochrome/quinol oxidase subunit 2
MAALLPRRSSEERVDSVARPASVVSDTELDSEASQPPANAANANDRMAQGLRRLRTTRVLAALFLAVVGIVATLIAFFVVSAQNKRDAASNFVGNSDACASAVKTSLLLSAIGFQAVVGAQDARPMVFDPYAFKESAAGMFTNTLVRNVVLYRYILEVSKAGWEADMTAAFGRQVTVLNGTTGRPAGSASAYLVSEMVVSNSTDRAMSFYPGLDILSASVPTGKPSAQRIAAVLNAVTRIFRSQPAVLPPITSHVAGKNVTAITLGRGIHISQAADFEASAPDVTYTVRANGYPTAASVAYVPPPPAQYQNRLDTTAVKFVAGMVVDAGKLFSLVVNATQGLPGVYGHYTSTGALGGKVAGVYMEDISDLPQVLNNSRLPSGASSPNMLLSNAGIDVQPGDGLYITAGLHGPASTSAASGVLTVGGSSDGGLTLHLKQEFEREEVLALFSPARLQDKTNAVVSSVIIAYAFRQYLISFVSADDYLATERPASWPYLILGLGITFIVSMMMYVCLWAAQKRRRETLKRQREAELREKAMLVVQNDVMALLSHEVRFVASVVLSSSVRLPSAAIFCTAQLTRACPNMYVP